MGELVRIVNEQESFLKGIAREARDGSNSYEMMVYPRGYVGVQRSVRDIARVGNAVGNEMMYEKDNLGKAYLKIRSFLSEKILGRKRLTIDELLEIQSRNIMALNSSLKQINEEARTELGNLIGYYEQICDEFTDNILNLPQRQKTLKEKTQELTKTRELLSRTKGYNEERFRTEKKFRDVRRKQSEEEHSYAMRLRDAVRLEQEKAFLDIMEQLLRKSIHISEMYSMETENIERHVEKTKSVYIRLIKQQGGFFMLKEGMEKLNKYVMSLQTGIMKGVGEMSNIVNGIDSLDAVYAPNIASLKRISNDVRNAYSERAAESEDILNNKLLER